MAKKEIIALGSGKLYTMEFDGTTIPTDLLIEVLDNRLGLISGGASLEYKSDYTDVEDDLGIVKKSALKSEEATLKSGLMTWDANTLKKICSTARVTEDLVKKTTTVKIGGVNNQDGKQYVIRFVNYDATDKITRRITIVGTNRAGFSFAFAKDKETIIDTEFKAMPLDGEGTIIIYTETFDA